MGTARGEHGKAGPQRVAQASEEARREWVTKRLVDYGRLRAQSLGWPDVYTLTKALGERVAEQLWSESGHRLSIVRPAIVEGALAHPYPGWIDGYKMADPLIIAYGRGILPEFPGLPDSVLDLIPVDFVVNAILAVAAAPPEPSNAAYFHVSSGARNPLPFRAMYEHVHEYFRHHPMPDSERGHIQVPSWRFPGTSQVERMLRTGERAVELAERTLLRMPASDRTRDWMGAVHRRQQDLEVLRKYADLYQSYTQAEVIYDDRMTHALHESLPAQRRSEHGFDAADIDWTHYLQGVHFPAVTELMRAFSARPRSRAGAASLVLPERQDVAAVFDLEGTVVASNAIEHYLWAKLATMPRSQLVGRSAGPGAVSCRDICGPSGATGVISSAPSCAATKASTKRSCAGWSTTCSPRRCSSGRCPRQCAGFDIIATPAIGPCSSRGRSTCSSSRSRRCSTRSSPGTCTAATACDRLSRDAAPGRRGKGGLAVASMPTTTASTCRARYAYGDSHSDRPLLELVGNPQAVNPDPYLFRHAKRRHWHIHRWGQHTQGPLEALVTAFRDGAGAMILALEYQRSPTRYLAARAVSPPGPAVDCRA